MKHVVAFGLLVAICAAAPAQAQPAGDTSLRLESTVSTRTARVGDPVQLRTTSPLVIDGWSIPAGRAARGEVAHVRRPGRVRGRAELAIALVAIARPDGTMLPVTAASSRLEARSPMRRVPGVPAPPPTIPILTGMVAGYGAAALASHWSNSEETVVGTGVVAGLATGVLVGVLKRGADLTLLAGTTIDVVFEP